MDKKIKQVIVVRKDLNMRKGKIAAQAGHACVLAIFKTMNKLDDFCWQVTNEGDVCGRDDSILSEWMNNNYTKICLYVNSEEELLDIANKAKEADIIYALVRDAGFTEFHGEPTYTCLAFGPTYSEDIDKITGELPLF